jgi:hypothetical protein
MGGFILLVLTAVFRSGSIEPHVKEIQPGFTIPADVINET